MKRKFRGAAFAAAPLIIGTTAYAQEAPYTAPRNASVDATGAKMVEVEAAEVTVTSAIRANPDDARQRMRQAAVRNM